MKLTNPLRHHFRVRRVEKPRQEGRFNSLAAADLASPSTATPRARWCYGVTAHRAPGPSSAHTGPTIRWDPGTLSICALLSEERRDVQILGPSRLRPFRFHTRHQDDVDLFGGLDTHATATVDAWYTSVGID